MSEKNVDTKKKMVLSAIQQIEKRASKEIVVDQERQQNLIKRTWYLQ
jgi:hypothetical protein